MYRLSLSFYIVLLYAFGYWCAPDLRTFRQERAKLNYQNPKYIKDMVVFTGRKSRNDPYLTNMTGTLLVPYGNNVTFVLTLSWTAGGDFRIESKVCDTVKTKWMRDFMSTYTNLTLSKCPFAPGRYRYMNMELPPRNLPIPIVDGDCIIKYELYVSATKELIMSMQIILHFDQNKKTRKG